MHFKADPAAEDAAINEKVQQVRAPLQSTINRGSTERKSLLV